ncbi:hypothetical protein CBF29_11135 [Vagococcus elongatus]|uniref:Uncharacterized protein n=1 Tax=Vagococcus elongatus TaxID=180344 RepID=A0A430AN66_9ENTE|nr:hypothetical protein CBF29_11135 [Vagococcus elongatus]
MFYSVSKPIFLQNLIETGTIFIDGPKLEANVNKCTFFWKKLQNYEAKLAKKIKRHLSATREVKKHTFYLLRKIFFQVLREFRELEFESIELFFECLIST